MSKSGIEQEHLLHNPGQLVYIQRSTFISRHALLIHCCLLSISVVCLLSAVALPHRNHPVQNSGEIGWSPVVNAVPAGRVRWNETFYYPTKYPSRFSGPPSAAVDHEWRRFTAHPMLDGRNGTLVATREEVNRLVPLYGQPWRDSIVEVEHDGSSQYMATLEIFHHLHCLNLLRKAVHPEYYHEFVPASHFDHCIESLREALMCNAGTGMVMFHWMDDQVKPYPDYNTFHQCRDPESILTWALDHAAPLDEPLTKPGGVFAMSDVPY